MASEMHQNGLEVNPMTLKAPGVLTPNAPVPKKRDTHDPHAMPSAPRGMMHSPTVHDVRELEPGAPKGRAPDGTIIDEETLGKSVPPPKHPTERAKS